MGDLRGRGEMPLGLSPMDPVVTERGGGMHTELGYRLDLIPPGATLRVGAILKLGADKGYGKDNWRLLSVESHVNHALGHIMGWIMGEVSADHLAHAACRLLFAMETDKEEKP